MNGLVAVRAGIVTIGENVVVKNNCLMMVAGGITIKSAMGVRFKLD